MAKKQNNKDFMSSQDFLGDLFKSVGKSTGASLFEKLSTNARQEAIQPLVKSLQTQALTKPLIDLKNKADEAQKAGMAAYIAANPEIDESLLYDGTGNLVNSIMQQNNLRFRQINQQLSFMDIRNPRYQELANELNKINTTSAQLREDNKKLLGIRNLMKDDNAVERLSDGMTDAEKALYNDILIGNRQNFVNINGKLHWQNPDNANEDPIAISSIDAAGPVYANSVVMEKHIGLYSEVINAKFVDDKILHSKINNLWNMEGVGNAGLKSFIFDNEGAEDILGFDTNEWFDTWFQANNIAKADEEAEKERIRNAGVLTTGTNEDAGNVKQHFSAWYHSKLKSSVASQYNLLNPNPNKNNPVIPIKPLPTGNLDKKLLPELNENKTYKTQTGTGDNFGIAKSPFAGITQFGWNITTDPKGRTMSSDDHLFEFGDDDYVINTLNREYSKYGFEFIDAGSDEVQVKYKGKILATFEFDKMGDDKSEAKKLQKAMHIAAEIPLEEEVDDLPLNVQKP